MDVYSDEIRNLSAVEKLRLVERIWDDLAVQDGLIPLPDWAIQEAARRRDEMLANPQIGLAPEEVWQRIDNAHNG